MSRAYQMHLTVTRLEKSKAKAIIRAAKKEWTFDDVDSRDDDDGPHVECCGDGNLCGGETEEAFASRLTKAVFKANGKPCKVHVEATFLEAEPPCTDYDFDENNQPA